MSLPWLIKDYYTIQKQLKNNKDFKIKKFFPVVRDREQQSANISGFYFYQDLVVAQKIHKNNPQKHVDIGSRIDGFVASVASFRPIELFDIRPLQHTIPNVTFVQADLMYLPKGLENYCDSISSLSVLEHFGLGRYGDSIDVDGHIKGLQTIYKVLKKGGKFYVSLPIGPQRIEFNAHRVFDLAYLLDIFQAQYKIDSFCYVDDEGYFHNEMPLSQQNIQNNCGCSFGNGIFELTKL